MRKDYESFKKQALQKEGVKALYEELKPLFELKNKLISLRKEAGLSQEQMALKMHTTKSSISRLESINSTHLPSLKSLENYARALGKSIKIEII